MEGPCESSDVSRSPVRSAARRSAGARGLTLIELMIGLCIAALMATLAYPAFTAQLDKGRVAQAIGDIRQLEMSLERVYTTSGRYPANLDAMGSPVDPWGRPYRYLRMDDATVGQVRKDKSLHPLNTDYDLYSMGADGKSATPLTAKASKDDIIRARNGGFVGLAADY